MKNIYVPYIPGLEALTFEELDRRMELHASKDFIGEVNWKEYSHKPSVSFRIARSEKCLAILYDVRGMDLRAVNFEDNGPVWEDSCCEFFISHPSDGTYYNFELNCIGTLLGAKRRSRTDADMFPLEKLSKIVRHATLERKAYDQAGDMHCWSAAVCIPFEFIGMDPEALPESIRANFYKGGDLTAHPHYLSWNRIGTPAPDFHRPEFFGELRFCDEA